MAFYKKYIVCYDIKDSRKRKRFSDYLKNLGLQRLQYSVFYGDLNRAEFRSLVRYAKKELCTKTDKAFWINTRIQTKDLKSGIGYDDFPYQPPDGHIIGSIRISQ